ncbi:MAG: efflux RND transporter periplasmic adaptor subunit [Planctomycetota bacterium]|jgi:RND family efflux transporter MFP subunit
MHLREAMIGIIGVVCAAGCREPNQFVAPPPPKVTVARPLVQEIVTFREMTGRAVPVTSVEIRARVKGYLKSIEFVEGAIVKEGDLLYTIEPDQYRAAVEAARADQTGALAGFERSEAEYDRIKGLKTQNAAAKMEIVDAKAKYERSKAAILAAEAALAKADLDLSYTQITAPISGRINRTEVNVGNLVGADGATILTTIVPWDPIHVYVTVGERTVLRLTRREESEGREAEEIPVFLRLADGYDYDLPGFIDYLDNQLDPKTGTLDVRVKFPNPDNKIVPGGFTYVRVPTPLREALLIPEFALQRDLTGFYAMVVTSEGEADRRNVEIGEMVETYREILSGLEPEESVVIKGLQRIRPGLKVDSQTEELQPVDLEAALKKAGEPNPPLAPEQDTQQAD